MARKEGAVAETPEAQGTAGESTQAPAPRPAARYVRTDKAPEKELRGQAKETFDILAGSTEPLTAAQIAEKAVYAGSRQDKTRVAAFYLAAFKKRGLVSVAA